MPKQTKQQRNAEFLESKGMVEVPRYSGKYRVFVHGTDLDPNDNPLDLSEKDVRGMTKYFLGKSGATRRGPNITSSRPVVLKCNAPNYMTGE